MLIPSRSHRVRPLVPLRQAIAALVVIALSPPAIAHAQSPLTYPPACEDSKVSATDRERAHDLFKLGKQFLAESNYDRAIALFRESYGIGCNVHEILTIIATALERKGDRAEAIRALEEYLRRVPNATDREVIERRIKNLREHIEAQPSIAPVPSTLAPSPAGPGPSDGASSQSPAVSSPQAPRDSAPTSSSGPSVWPWVVAGAGGALLVTGGVLFGVGHARVNEAEEVCGPEHQCPPGDRENVEKGKSGQTLEAVGLIVGGAGLAAGIGGLVWHFLERPGERESRTARKPHVAPSFGPGYAGVAIGGRF